MHTGQHYDRELSDVFFEELGLAAPDFDLGVAGGSNASQVERMTAGLADVLQSVQPDLVVVYGDTNSTLAGAQIAARAGVPVAHVEAGLRSFDLTMPEETNRVACDALAALLLCPSQTAVDNLVSEGVSGQVVLTGDVMGDVALRMGAVARERSTALLRFELEPKAFLLLTAHRAGNVDSPQRLLQLVELIETLPQRTIFPLHPRTRARLEEHGLAERVSRASLVTICEPLGYLDTLLLAQNARAVVTDSGGLQKEAIWLGTPVVTLRDRTEWVETVTEGWNTLVDLDPDQLLRALEKPLPAISGASLYAAGLAGAAVVDAIDDYLTS
ncbi:MAG: UDP-N-acetylglucosamine 2-epimerase (non-hydrolyzing) [Thermoleophilaceae bacterium]|nr:UDP-N-acetylglucosamine 2-epimerase (non-hydrolyzing) [Thermoleophilaceae bacterium]